MIDRQADLFNKVVYNEEEHLFLRIINQQNPHWYCVKILGKTSHNEYSKRDEILANFEIVPDESSVEEWDLFMKKAGYTAAQIQFLKDCNDTELADSFMPATRPMTNEWDY